MKLTIDYTGQLAIAAGHSEETLELAEHETTLEPVLRTLASRHGEQFSAMVFSNDGKIRSTLFIALDDKQAVGEKESIPLSGVAVLLLMTPIAGG